MRSIYFEIIKGHQLFNKLVEVIIQTYIELLVIYDVFLPLLIVYGHLKWIRGFHNQTLSNQAYHSRTSSPLGEEL